LVAVAERDVIARAPARIAQVGAGHERPPVHLGGHGRHHDPGVDAVGAQEDLDAVTGLGPAVVGGDEAEQQSEEQIEDRHGCQAAEQSRRNPQPLPHPSTVTPKGRLRKPPRGRIVD
jgi:hypothetical protein